MGYFPRPLGPRAGEIAAVFATGVVTDDLFRYLAGSSGSPRLPQHATLSLTPVEDLADDRDVIEWMRQYGPARQQLLASSSSLIDDLMRKGGN